MKKILSLFLALLFVSMLLLPGQTVWAAEPKEANLVNLEASGDLVVMFSYDAETVDITFISPSGAEKKYGDEGVVMTEGDLWRTYKIVNAEAGQWKVRYELGSNKEIQFSIVEQNLGIWLQYVTASVVDQTVEVRFLTKSSSVSSYQYTLYAVASDAPDHAIPIGSGSASMDEEVVFSVSDQDLSSGTYCVKVDISAPYNDAELFDSLVSEEFTYQNPNDPESMSAFSMEVDLKNGMCSMNWTDYTERGQNGYRVNVYADDEIVYHHELPGDQTQDGFTYPIDTTVLRVELQHQQGKLWSKPLVRTLDLSAGDSFSLRTGEITGENQAIIDYNLQNPRTMSIYLEGELTDTVELSGSGFFSAPLHPDVNDLEVRMPIDETLCYFIRTNIFNDIYPPDIQLYDDLDGKIFTTDSFRLIGRVSGCKTLTINGTGTEFGENGDFSAQVSLSAGENILEIVAADQNGNDTMRTVRVIYKTAPQLSSDSADLPLWVQYLPLLATLLTSALIALVSWAFLRRTAPRKLRVGVMVSWDVLIGIAELICAVIWLLQMRFNQSPEFVDFVEQSQTKAVTYLHLQELLGKLTLVGAGLLVFMILLTVLISRRNHPKEKR